jgi:hypothetical protein
MPTLSFDIPNSDWAVLEEERKREGLRSVRELVIWRLRRSFALPSSPPEPKPEPAAA